MSKSKILLMVFVSLLPFGLNAAGPAMHVLLGESWLAHFAPQYTEDEKRAFLLGTVFPDIRYMGVLKREDTHFRHVTLEKVAQAKTPFQRGVLFHSFVDEYRDKYVRRSKIESKLLDIPERFRDTFLKLVEDQIIHSEHEWAQFRNFLATIQEEELKYGLSTQIVTQWHTGLTLYFTAEPRIILAQFSLLDRGVLSIDAATIQLWNTYLPKYAKDPLIQSFLNNMLASFDQALNQETKKTASMKEAVVKNGINYYY